MILHIPDEDNRILLHACCAPCSSAILEVLIENTIETTVFYYNPNIYPVEEYEIRKAESKRQCEALGVRWIDGDYDHPAWQCQVRGLEEEPERGSRCQMCFDMRLLRTAQEAQKHGIRWFSTTLASSRWKDIRQIEEAGHRAESIVKGTSYWTQNWRKGGLTERRAQLLREGGFYNQQYCGCEYSIRDDK
ncbi:MAG: epoxyqueuosine reductase QueH [Marinilabiliaceae bacterium]|nr:epoxyqueuosine reductase QueH [Marinilabiliaceae bacterium]